MHDFERPNCAGPIRRDRRVRWWNTLSSMGVAIDTRCNTGSKIARPGKGCVRNLDKLSRGILRADARSI
jgi:hypothetical protein